MDRHYALIDSGDGEKLERFGEHLLRRPCSIALWHKQKSAAIWDAADGVFSREEGSHWQWRVKAPRRWTVEIEGLKLHASPTDFGHVGLFAEHQVIWRDVRKAIHDAGRPLRVLNLFAYSGAATLIAAQAGAEVCHLDAARGMVDWANDNAKLSGLSGAPIRWIVDDAIKFLKRESKRNSLYDIVILDPPSYGQGDKGQVFKIEREIQPLLHLVKEVLTPSCVGIFFTCHTPGFTPTVLHNLFTPLFGQDAHITTRELLLTGNETLPICFGSYAHVDFSRLKEPS